MKEIDRFTDLEKDIMHLLVKGYTNYGIADELKRSQATVGLYLNKLYIKLNVPQDRCFSKRISAIRKWEELSFPP